MLRRLLLIGLGFAVYAGLGGCVVHAHRGPNVHNRTTPPNTRVYNVNSRPGKHLIDVKVRHHDDHPDAYHDGGPDHDHHGTPPGHTKGHGKSKGKNRPDH